MGLDCKEILLILSDAVKLLYGQKKLHRLYSENCEHLKYFRRFIGAQEAQANHETTNQLPLMPTD